MDDPINHILTSDLSASLQTLCVFVLNNADEDGWCYVSQSEMGEKLGVSQAAISQRESRTDFLDRDGQRVRVIIGGEPAYKSSDEDISTANNEAGKDKPKANTISSKDKPRANSISSDKQSLYPNPYEAAPANTPSRKKKVSTPSKKNSTPPSDTPSLGSVVSGDGAPSHADLELVKGLPEDNTKHPAVGIFASKAHFSPSEYDRKRLIEVVGEEDTERFSNRIGLWRKTAEEWRQNDYNWSNFDGLLDRYTQKLENYGIINRSDYNGGLDLPEGEDVTAEEAGYAHLLEER
ncbi:hypothetical protein [Salinibacter ruber]|uniref:hypothetical protein n=1 Tax=Salinibacter ruber TaxID=146919 RepID=UPI002169C06D|nr:hypothetical protein [Salinibacter ruber]MCS3610951.1 hypothetical protein [Salinibacter ruber]